MMTTKPTPESRSQQRKHPLTLTPTPTSTDNHPLLPSSLKRLRGGGGDNDNDNDNEDYYDMDDIDPPDDYFPDDDGDLLDNHHNQSSNFSWTDQTDSAIHYSQLSTQQLQKWSRKPLPTNFDNQRDIHFQWLDIDMTNHAQPLAKNPNECKKDRKVVGAQKGAVPVIRVYGVTDEGYSIVTFLHGYTPYGYFALPEGFDLECSENGFHEGNWKKDEVLGKIRMRLNDLLSQSKTAQRNAGGKGNDDGDFVQGVQYFDDKKSIMGYNTSHTKFLKVYVQTPSLVPTLKRIMEEGVSLPHIVKSKNQNGGSSANIWDESGSSGESYQPFECNVPFVLRFMIDEDVNGAGWITLPKGTYQLRTEESGLKSSHCQVSSSIRYTDIFIFHGIFFT